MQGADLVHRIAFTFGYRYAPVGGIRWWFSREPGDRLDMSDKERFEWQMQLASKVTDPKDLDFCNNEDLVRVYLRSTREAFGQEFESARDDGRLIRSNWGFRVEDVPDNVSVHLWYGEQDTFVPVNHGVTMAERMRYRAKLRVEDETHASIWLLWQREIMQNIVRQHLGSS